MKVLFLLCTIYQASSFAPLVPIQPPIHLSTNVVASTEESSLRFLKKVSLLKTLSASLASLSLVPSALALDDFYSGSQDIEVADLPSPYVPVLFGFALLGGVALLTGSLGDVMTEESSLGLQSGARAKKEMERSRSSYFKK